MDLGHRKTSLATPRSLALALTVAAGAALVGGVGCGGGGGGGGGGGPPPVPDPGTVSTRSSTIGLSVDGNHLVVANADVGTVTVFQPTGLVKVAEIPVGHEPSSVVVHKTNPTAYVANAADGTVSVVTLPSGPVTTTIAVGSEPLGLALSPNSTRLYVANAVSNTLSVVDTATNLVVTTVDLSAFGNSPRAIAVTDNGDAVDTDETVFVAMFFGQLRAGKTSTQEGQDDEREGRVVALSAATNAPLGAPNPILLSPIAVTGFNSNGQLAPSVGVTPAIASTNPQTFTTPTGAYPNQLAALAIQPTSSRAYVVSTAASPNGPLRFNQMVQGLVSVFDTTTRAEVTAAQTDPTVRRTAPLNMNQGINLGTTPAPRLFLSNPVAVAWRPDGSDAWAVIQNSDLLVRMTVDAGGIPSVANPLVAGPSTLVRVDLQSVAAGQIAGKAPRGVVIDAAGGVAYVHNFVSRSVTAVDISNATAPAIAATAQSTPAPAPASLGETLQLGAELFYTGRGPQTRMSQESWGGCIVCHPNGRADGVTWMFEAGPRQTIPLDGTFSKSDPTDQRILNWSAVRDENHDFELNTRGIFGGRGLIDDDRLFLAFGGTAGPTAVDSALIEQFQQATGAVGTTNDLANDAPLPDLTVLGARRDFASATLPDGRVFLIGGRSGLGSGSLVGASTAVLQFDPRTNLLTQKSSTGFTLRHSLGAAAVRTNAGFRIYAIGGYTNTTVGLLPTGVVEEYNPATDSWRTVASLPTPTAQFGITVAGGINGAEPLQLIHVVSGNAGTEGFPSVLTGASIVQRFQADPVGPGTWSGFSVVGLTPRRNVGAATVVRGVTSRVFVIGGVDGGGTTVTTVDEYLAQAVTPVASAHTALPAARASFGVAGTLSTNQIYVVGGVDGTGTDVSTVFEYTVGTNGPVAGPAGTPSGAWVTRGNLSLARRALALSSPPPVTNFLPVQSAGRDARQDAIAKWVATIRAARGAVLASDPAAVAGRALFGTVGLVQPGFSCATCHGGSKWTRSKVDYVAPPSTEVGLGLGNERVLGAELRQTATQPSLGVLINVGTFTPNSAGGRVNEIRVNPADVGVSAGPLGASGFNIPSLLSVSETAPYYYSGLAQTLDGVLDGSNDSVGGGTRHHFVTSAAQRAQLIAFLRSIDANTPTFP